MNPVVLNGIEKLFQQNQIKMSRLHIFTSLINKMETFQKSNAIFH